MTQGIPNRVVQSGNGAARDPLLAALDRIEAKLDGLERRLGALERSNEHLGHGAKALPQLAAVAVDSFDAWVEALAARGIDVDAHARSCLLYTSGRGYANAVVSMTV